MTETTVLKVLPRLGLAAPALAVAAAHEDASLRKVLDEETRHVTSEGQATRPWLSLP